MRHGNWMQTYGGRQFWPLDPCADEIHIEDIAHALSNQCRYAGHCLRFYSVAEHSVHVANAMSWRDHARWALLHDASEAYLVDVPRPVKPFLAGYREAEIAVMQAVCQRFGLPPTMPAEVHEADDRIISDERSNLSRCVVAWDHAPEPLGVTLQCWEPSRAREEFLRLFGKLFPEEV